ncbi:alpha beta fold hydrolase, putative [Babesia ovis]|uniref:Alpha beta fold hydrolase, putative n=1 Tax=Babesia ovis TaxID=5869 RepID=A0A9W5TBP1_BABOV|nr:alpha beta fold hydrolase, putative [Babesia ovis]
MFTWAKDARPNPSRFLRLRLPFEFRQFFELFPRLRVIRFAWNLVTNEVVFSICSGLAICLILYYELCYVSLVCPYFTGDELSPYLNRFRSVGKTYRPTFYMFSARFQWYYLDLFCKLNRCYNYLLHVISGADTSFKTRLLRVFRACIRKVLESFLFRRLFRGQAKVSIREFLEGNNGALVVLDYYLPKWMGCFCPQCGKFRQEPTSRNKDGTFHLNKQPRIIHTNEADIRARMATVSSVNKTSDKRQLVGRKRGEPPLEKRTQGIKDILSIANIECSRSCDPNDLMEEHSPRVPHPTNTPESKFLNSDPLPRKILRGVIAIVGDINVSYSICNQDFNCQCGKPEPEPTKPKCKGCATSMYNDANGLNTDAPSMPTVRYLINDALELGFACVHIHLNVNMGIASEGFPTWTGLRCFPLSLYSDVLIDLDNGLKRISDRYPNLPLSCVGVGYGSNVLMEYLSLGSAKKPVSTTFDPSSSLRKGIQRRSILTKRGVWLNVEESNDSYTSSDTESDVSPKQNNLVKDYITEVLTDTEMSINSKTARLIKSTTGRTPGIAKQIVQIKKPEPPKPTNINDPNYEPFMYLHKVIRDIDLSRSGGYGRLRTSMGGIIVSPKDGHFHVVEEADECTYETSVVYPPQQPSEVVFDTKRISAVVCINLNLCGTSNVLYKSTQFRDVSRSSVYVRYCNRVFRQQLLALFREVHCHRRGESLRQECHSYNCCHYARSVSKRPALRRFLHSLRHRADGFVGSLNNETLEQLILNIHREYRHSYRQMRRRNLEEHVNYNRGIFKRFGARGSTDFKLCALMTLRYVYSNVGHDGRNRIETVSGDPTYTLVNNRVNSNLRLGRAHFQSGIRRVINHGNLNSQDARLCRYLSELINREYTNNVVNIRRHYTSITVPTLLLSSFDNSLFTKEDVDIFDVVKNPNIVHYVSNSGGYSTFLSGIYPAPWFSVPILEFLEEMVTRRALIP